MYLDSIGKDRAGAQRGGGRCHQRAQLQLHAGPRSSKPRKARPRPAGRKAAKPFLELRQKLYTDALKAAAILSTPENRTPADLGKARQRFRELYVAELSMVEVGAVESKMVELATQIDPALLNMTPSQRATYELAHSLRDSFIPDWGIQALH